MPGSVLFSVGPGHTFSIFAQTMEEGITMRTADATWLELRQKKNFDKFLTELKEYLKSKLTLIEVKDCYSYWSCGHEYHHWSDRAWKPFNN